MSLVGRAPAKLHTNLPPLLTSSDKVFFPYTSRLSFYLNPQFADFSKAGPCFEVYAYIHVLQHEQWFRKRLHCFCFFSERGNSYSQQLFEKRTKIERWVAIQGSGTKLNHTTLWMDPPPLLCPSVLSVCYSIYSQCQGEGHYHAAYLPNKSRFLYMIHKWHWSLAVCSGRTVKFSYFQPLRCDRCDRSS